MSKAKASKSRFQKRVEKLRAKSKKLKRIHDPSITLAEYERLRRAQSSPYSSKGIGSIITELIQKLGELSRALNLPPAPEDFDTHAEYADARRDFQIREHMNRVKKFSRSRSDFESVISKLSNVPLTPVLEELVVTSENGPEILYYLGKHPREAKRISKMTPIRAARAIGAIEAAL
jgi:hypothetical protein